MLDPHAIAFLSLVNDEKQYGLCLRHIEALQIPSGYRVEKIAVFGAQSMAEGYQEAMEASVARYKIYVHQDVYLVHRGLLLELLNLFTTHPRLGLVGIVGATQLPRSAIWWVNNALHSYGRIWEYIVPGGFPLTLLGPFNRRRYHFMRFRSFVGDYMPAVAVDGLFMATQYDVPWRNSLGGFELYDEVQALEFIKAGLEVGIARQEAIWLLNWGPLQEPSREQRQRRDSDLFRRAAAMRQQNGAYIGVPAWKLLAKHSGAADFQAPDPVGERLGVVIMASNGREAVLRTLRALLPQCEAMKGVEYQVVVVENAPPSGAREAVLGESPKVTVIANDSNGGSARALNAGLRNLMFPRYVLVTRDDAEFSGGTLIRMVSYLREHASAAGVVASLLNPDGVAPLQRTGILPIMLRRPRRAGQIALVGTACALVRGEVFLDVGLYDERLSAGYEDVDWSLRAKRRRHTFAYLPDARVIYHRRESIQPSGPVFFAERSVARLWLCYKHAGRRWAAALYWAQQLRAKWLAFRWRHDSNALRQIGEAMALATGLYRKFRAENRRPLLL